MDIVITRGDSCLISFSLKDGDNVHEMQDGERLSFTVKTALDRDEAVISKTYGDGITYNAVTQKYEIELNASCSCELKRSGFFYDIEYVSSNGKVKTLARGLFSIILDCTKPCNRGE